MVSRCAMNAPRPCFEKRMRNRRPSSCAKPVGFGPCPRIMRVEVGIALSTGTVSVELSSPSTGSAMRTLLGVERLQIVDALRAHLTEVACDAAVVADQLALIGFGVFDVGVMKERLVRLATRRRQAVLEGATVFPRQESFSKAHVDVIPRLRRIDGASAEIGLADRRETHRAAHPTARG